MKGYSIPTKVEYDILFEIESKLGKESLTNEELSTMKKQAEKGSPRWEFVWGEIELFEFNSEKNAIEWFEKALKHMNGTGLLRCSEILASIGDEWADLSMRFLKRAAWRQNPIAKGMLKQMKENPFELPQA